MGPKILNMSGARPATMTHNPAMHGSGPLNKLLASGLRYMFVSISDNLGAPMDLKSLTHFVQSGAPFIMEVAARTDADKKGGHLAPKRQTEA